MQFPRALTIAVAVLAAVALARATQGYGLFGAKTIANVLLGPGAIIYAMWLKEQHFYRTNFATPYPHAKSTYRIIVAVLVATGLVMATFALAGIGFFIHRNV
jgi:hypothetical protein